MRGSILNKLAPGDVLVYSGTGWLACAVNLFTFGPSHVAVLAEVDRISLEARRIALPLSLLFERVLRNRPLRLVFESTTQADFPCAIQGQRVDGVQAHTPSELPLYPGRVWRLPLLQPLNETESIALTGGLLNDLGRPYDYGAAGLSATRWLKRMFWWRTMDRQEQYCVELVGSKLLEALRARLNGRTWNAGALTPRQFVRVLLDTGLYGEPERIK